MFPTQQCLQLYVRNIYAFIHVYIGSNIAKVKTVLFTEKRLMFGFIKFY
jgi:hypothetical protein